MIINLYGFFIALGILVGVLVVEKINNKFLILNSQFSIFNFLAWLLIPGIIGARLYHVIDYWDFYSENLAKILYVWEGGLGIFGGIIGGIFGAWIFLKLKTKNQKPKTQIKNVKIFLSFSCMQQGNLKR